MDLDYKGYLTRMKQYLVRNLDMLLEWLFSKQFIGSVLIIIFTVIILKVMSAIQRRSRKLLDKTGVMDKSSGIIYDILRIGIILFAVIMILQLNGINVTSLIAGLGIVSLVAGLALQDTMKDLIMGFHIILDHFYAVGDSIRIGDCEGIIVDFNLRTTKLKNFADDSLVVFCNRNVSQVFHCSEWFDIDIGLSYGEDVNKINAVLEKTAAKIKTLGHVENCLYLGTQNFLDSSVSYRLRIYAKPELKYKIRRAAVQVIQRDLNASGLEIPFNQLDIHQSISERPESDNESGLHSRVP